MSIDLSFLDTVEKILVGAGIVAVIAAILAPNLAWLGITWTTGRQRWLAVVGVLFLALAFLPLRNYKASNTDETKALRQRVRDFVTQQIEGNTLPLVAEATKFARAANERRLRRKCERRDLPARHSQQATERLP
jgi:hypothetical protein